MDIALLALFILFTVLVSSSIRVLREYERAVIFRLGRITPARGPGPVILIPWAEKMVRVDLRLVTMDVEKQDVITRDNVSIVVSAVVYFRVVDPAKAILAVEDYLQATAQLGQTTLRSVAGQADLDELLSERDRVNHRIQGILDQHTESWGIEVALVELKQIDLPAEMQRAMAKQAEAERERRAKIIAAEGELQASEKLAQAALVLDQTPTALQLRYLQTLVDISSDKSSTTIFPIPMDLLTPFLRRGAA